MGGSLEVVLRSCFGMVGFGGGLCVVVYLVVVGCALINADGDVYEMRV